MWRHGDRRPKANNVALGTPEWMPSKSNLHPHRSAAIAQPLRARHGSKVCGSRRSNDCNLNYFSISDFAASVVSLPTADSSWEGRLKEYMNHKPPAIALIEKVSDLFSKWTLWKRLFMHSQERLDVLNHDRLFPLLECADHAIYQYVVMGITRLTDRPKRGRRGTFVVKRLLVDAKLSRGSQERRVACRETRRLHLLVKSLRQKRNKLLAHNDERVSLGIVAPPRSKYKRVEFAMRAIARLTNIIGQQSGMPPLDFRKNSETRAADTLQLYAEWGRQREREHPKDSISRRKEMRAARKSTRW